SDLYGDMRHEHPPFPDRDPAPQGRPCPAARPATVPTLMTAACPHVTRTGRCALPAEVPAGRHPLAVAGRRRLVGSVLDSRVRAS
ncbi:MAG: hypothetical protein LBI49_07190, partial [Nocardiopsaceae bacterium]|nr:hypothetical protein [Nocardiopsaceae bacterium]